MSPNFKRERVLIWGKTYPELSSRYTETVCTAGVREDGSPVRLYPVPLRYLESEGHYRLYDWIDVPMAKSGRDTRPESYKVNAPAIRCVGHVSADEHEWAERAALIFRDRSWLFSGMAELNAAQTAKKTSLGIVRPGEIVNVLLRRKAESKRVEYERKATELAAAGDLFRPEYKELGYRDHEIVLQWRCAERCQTCSRHPHNMQVLDWGLLELARKNGWDWQKALSRMQDLATPGRYDLQLFLGNTKAHPRNFLVVGLWYPKIRQQLSIL